MTPAIAAILSNADQGDYNKLPPAIQQYYTPRQWSFLSDTDKARVMITECEPEA